MKVLINSADDWQDHEVEDLIYDDWSIYAGNGSHASHLGSLHRPWYDNLCKDFVAYKVIDIRHLNKVELEVECDEKSATQLGIERQHVYTHRGWSSEFYLVAKLPEGWKLPILVTYSLYSYTQAGGKKFRAEEAHKSNAWENRKKLLVKR